MRVVKVTYSSRIKKQAFVCDEESRPAYKPEVIGKTFEKKLYATSVELAKSLLKDFVRQGYGVWDFRYLSSDVVCNVKALPSDTYIYTTLHEVVQAKDFCK